MGQVWKARDTRLGRTVAIKISAAKFSERFAQEARAIAALNHTNICTLYDVGPDYLVMEYVEGQEIKGPLPLDRALELAIQLAGALEAAHRKGITHRDLKPANILTTKSGVKVLDFGLAKVAQTKEAAANDETVTRALTQEGSIVGTLQYMAPEQLQGKETDARADIFSFGCVLYEMLTGKRAFDGANAASVIAAVMEREAPSVAGVAPAALDWTLRRCLAKDPDERWQSAGDLKAELVRIAGGGTEVPRQAEARATWVPWIAAGALTIVAAVAGWGLWRATRPVEHPLVRLSVDLGPDALPGASTTVAISPDGRRIVFPMRGPDGKQQLATRLLDQSQATLLPGTENGRDAFFSPDNQWIGFAADGKLKKISVQGGAPVTLCDAVNFAGGSWGEDGNIVFTRSTRTSLSRVPASGGALQPLTKLAGGEITHRWPQLLPGGKAVLFTAASSPAGVTDANVEVVDLRTGAVKVVQRGGYYGRYLPSGHLVYMNQGVLFAAPFDLAKVEVRGAPAPLLEDVAGDQNRGGGQFDFSAAPSGAGTLVYLAGKANEQQWPIVWLDSSGKVQPLLTTPGLYFNPRFSPDGRKLAVEEDSKGSDIFVYDLERGTMARLTFDGHSQTPMWSPDGARIAFTFHSGPGDAMMWTRSDGAGEPQKLLDSPNWVVPWSFSPDGRRLAYLEVSPDTGYDIWTLPLDAADTNSPKPGKPEPFLRTQFDELVPEFSPDGRWIAYRSAESGASEIYVRPAPEGAPGGVPAGGGKWQISTDGGLYAFWAKNGRELFYEAADSRIMVVDYTVSGGSFVPGKPRLWSEKRIFNAGRSSLDLAPDGKRFAVFPMPEAAEPGKGSVHVTFLLNFLDDLKRKMP